jgi:glutathione S-transferase
MKIYGDLISGNCLKVKWTCDRLGIPYEWMPVDVVAGETRTPAFLAMFPQGQVPAVDFEDGRTLAQSNGIMRYLARGSALLPEDAYTQARIDEWLFWEQYSHEPYIAVLRFHMRYLGKTRDQCEPWRIERGEKALDFMESRIAGRDYYVGGTVTIADIALLAYTRLAHEGGFDLSGRPGIRKWIARCEGALKLN